MEAGYLLTEAPHSARNVAINSDPKKSIALTQKGRSSREVLSTRILRIESVPWGAFAILQLHSRYATAAMPASAGSRMKTL